MARWLRHIVQHTQKMDKRDASIKQNRQTTKSAIGDVGTGNGNYETLDTHTHTHGECQRRQQDWANVTFLACLYLFLIILFIFYYSFFLLIIFCFCYFFRTLIAATRVVLTNLNLTSFVRRFVSFRFRLRFSSFLARLDSRSRYVFDCTFWSVMIYCSCGSTFLNREQPQKATAAATTTHVLKHT